jgi:tripartite-type tricarboxylate transporter receptor subunit TctC
MTQLGHHVAILGSFADDNLARFMQGADVRRREFIAGLVGATMLPMMARAENYPTRPVRIVVPFAPAGGTDVLGRLLGEWLSERLNQPFIIENRPGANTNVGAEAVIAAPDGYTLLITDPSPATNASLYEKLNYNFLRDIAPVSVLIRQPEVMVVNSAFPAKTVPEFIAYAKANPDAVNMASAGVGNVTHLAGELFKMMTGIQMTHLAYRGSGPALTDLLAGHVQVMFTSMPASIGYIRAGNLQALAVNRKLPVIPVFFPDHNILAGHILWVWALGLQTEGPDLPCCRRPSGLTSRVISFGSPTSSAMLFHISPMAELPCTIAEPGGNAVASEV